MILTIAAAVLMLAGCTQKVSNNQNEESMTTLYLTREKVQSCLTGRS